MGVSSVADDNVEHGLLSLTTEIVASFVGNNPVAIGDLPAVIASHQTINDPRRERRGIQNSAN